MASEKVKLTIHSPKLQEISIPAQHKRKSSILRSGRKRGFQEKLLQNSCFACALLLGILALGNLQQPWAKNTSAAIERALTMEIDLDKSLGQLEFVRKMMPESALVFFNLDGESEFLRPVQAEPVHLYTADQPWLLFSTEADADVFAPAEGTITALSPMSGGGYGVLIDHGGGLESVIAGLKHCDLSSGEKIAKGTILGKTDGSLYYELRKNGGSIDPTELMGF